MSEWQRAVARAVDAMFTAPRPYVQALALSEKFISDGSALGLSIPSSLQSDFHSLRSAGIPLEFIPEEAIPSHYRVLALTDMLLAPKTSIATSSSTPTSWSVSGADGVTLTFDLAAHDSAQRVFISIDDFPDSPWPPCVLRNYALWVALNPALWRGALGAYLRSRKWAYNSPVAESALNKALSVAAFKYSDTFDEFFGQGASRAVVGFDNLFGWIRSPTEALSKVDPTKPFRVIEQAHDIALAPKFTVEGVADPVSDVVASYFAKISPVRQLQDPEEFIDSLVYSTSGGSGYHFESQGVRFSLTKAAAALGPLRHDFFDGTSQPNLMVSKQDVGKARGIVRAPTSSYVRSEWLSKQYDLSFESSPIGKSPLQRLELVDAIASWPFKGSADVPVYDGKLHAAGPALMQTLLAKDTPGRWADLQLRDVMVETEFLQPPYETLHWPRPAVFSFNIAPTASTARRPKVFLDQLISGLWCTSKIGTLGSRSMVEVARERASSAVIAQFAAITAGDDILFGTNSLWYLSLTLYCMRFFGFSFKPSATIAGRKFEFLRRFFTPDAAYTYPCRAIPRLAERSPDASKTADASERLAELATSLTELAARSKASPALLISLVTPYVTRVLGLPLPVLFTPRSAGGGGLIWSSKWALPPRHARPLQTEFVPLSHPQVVRSSEATLRRLQLPPIFASVASQAVRERFERALRNDAVAAALARARRAQERHSFTVFSPRPVSASLAAVRAATALIQIPGDQRPSSAMVQAAKLVPPDPAYMMSRETFDLITRLADSLRYGMNRRLDLFEQFAPLPTANFIADNRRRQRGSVLLSLISGSPVGADLSVSHPLGETARFVVSGLASQVMRNRLLTHRWPTRTDFLLEARATVDMLSAAYYANGTLAATVSA